MALLVSLVLLLVLTTIAITAASTSSLQVRIAANSQQQNVAFQAAESGIREWLDTFENGFSIEALQTSGTLSETVHYSASAGTPGTCWDVIPAYSLDASDDNTSFQYACFNIQSTGKACVDSSCSDDNHPAKAGHLQGHLVRY
jgi:type IV pilus assembly protein PilX